MAATLFICILLLGANALGANAESVTTDLRPNIVYLIADDLGYGETGFQKNNQIPTPHLDALAASGVRCTAGYVTASLCSPSRAGMMTGRYQSRFGYEQNPIGKLNLDPTAGLPLEEVTLAQHLLTAGYTTSLVGKWHLGGTPERHPLKRGFESFWGFLHEGHFYVPGPPYPDVASFLRRKDIPNGLPQKREGNIIYSAHLPHDEPPYDEANPILQGTEPITEPLYLTEAITREAVARIKAAKEKPHFLMVAYNAVHSPMQAPTERLQAFREIPDVQRRIFAAMLSVLDDGVGEIMATLKQETQRPSLIIFVSDNGGPTKELTSSNSILRGGKGDLYEGGIRVPMLISWPNVLPAGTVYDRPVTALDLTATAMHAGKCELPVERPLDGVNLLPYLTRETRTDPHETIYWRMNQKTAVRVGDWKLIRAGRNAPWELFHLLSDPAESINMIDREPKLRQDLTLRWLSLDRQMAEVAPSR